MGEKIHTFEGLNRERLISLAKRYNDALGYIPLDLYVALTSEGVIVSELDLWDN